MSQSRARTIRRWRNRELQQMLKIGTKAGLTVAQAKAIAIEENAKLIAESSDDPVMLGYYTSMREQLER